jgi:hypothetical protein
MGPAELRANTIRALFKEGGTPEWIAEHLGLSYSAVRACCDKLPPPPGKKQPTVAQTIGAKLKQAAGVLDDFFSWKAPPVSTTRGWVCVLDSVDRVAVKGRHTVQDQNGCTAGFAEFVKHYEITARGRIRDSEGHGASKYVELLWKMVADKLSADASMLLFDQVQHDLDQSTFTHLVTLRGRQLPHVLSAKDQFFNQSLGEPWSEKEEQFAGETGLAWPPTSNVQRPTLNVEVKARAITPTSQLRRKLAL